jgi:hypothetical protein
MKAAGSEEGDRESDKRGRQLYWRIKEGQNDSIRRRLESHPAISRGVNHLLDPAAGPLSRVDPRGQRLPFELLRLPKWATRSFVELLTRYSEADVGAELLVPAGATEPDALLAINWAESRWDWQYLGLESVCRWARGPGWRDRQHMLWGLSWPLPVGSRALSWWAGSRSSAGWAGLAYDLEGRRLERPLTDEEINDANIDIDALPIPHRDVFGPDDWIGLVIERRVSTGIIALVGLIEHEGAPDDHIYVNRPGGVMMRLGEPVLLPPESLRGDGMSMANRLIRWYAPWQGLELNPGGRPPVGVGLKDYRTRVLRRAEELIQRTPSLRAKRSQGTIAEEMDKIVEVDRLGRDTSNKALAEQYRQTYKKTLPQRVGEWLREPRKSAD